MTTLQKRHLFHACLFLFNACILLGLGRVLPHAELAPDFTVRDFGCLFVLDFWAYCTHRSFHFKGLRYLHRLHHSDSILDASTALRFHWAQAALGGLVETALLILLRPSLSGYLVFIGLTWVSLLFHHSTISLTSGIQRLLGTVIITPALHQEHHRQAKWNQAGNFGVIFSLWDRMLGTLQAPTQDKLFGLEKTPSYRWQEAIA